MADNFATVLISAGVGGVAGAVFPAVKDAISFVVLESGSQIEKLYADLKLSIAGAKSRVALQKEVTEHTHRINTLVNQGQDLWRQYRAGKPFDDLSSVFVSTMLDLQSEQAYLGPFDLKQRLSPEAATHIAASIAFSDHMRSMLRMMRANEFSDRGVLERKDGDAPNYQIAMGRLIELQAAVDSSLSLWIRADDDEDRRIDHSMAAMEGTIRDLKRRRKLSIGFLIFMAVAAVVIVLLLVHYQGFEAPPAKDALPTK